MKNPGLVSFTAVTDFIKSPHHPLNIDPMEDDPDLESGDNDSDFVRGHDFGRWKTPGQSIKVPFHSPEGKTFYGEIVGKADHASAESILNGDHDSSAPSANPYVEHAREDLRTPGAMGAVDTLANLLRGGSPRDVGDVDEAHDYFSRHFTNVKVNPRHGVMLAQSPAGVQMAQRKTHPPNIRTSKPSYELVNRHGRFESRDPQRLIRTMVAFQIVHNQLAYEERKKKEKKEHHHSNLSTTAASVGDLAWAAKYLMGKGVDKLKGLVPQRAQVPPPLNAPTDAVFEPGYGTDVNHEGHQGGYVMSAENAPADWYRMGDTAYSPGHHMRLMLDPQEAMTPRADPRFPGHTFTYAPNAETGHTTARRTGGINYWVRKNVHPASQGAGFDHWPQSEGRRTRAPRPPVAPPAQHNPPHGLPSGGSGGSRVTGAAKSNLNDLCPVCASGYLESYDQDYHECLNCGSLVKHIGFEKEAARKPGERLLGPRGPLGRGLSDIPQGTSDPLGLADASADSDIPVVDLDETQTHHPLFGQRLDDDADVYEAPRRGYLLDKQASDWPDIAPGMRCPTCHSDDLYDRRGFRMYHTEPAYGCNDCGEKMYENGETIEPWEHGPDVSHQYFAKAEPTVDPLDEQLGKQGFFPVHKPGQEKQRAYLHEMPGFSGAYFRLTEGAANHEGEPTGWLLTADHIPNRAQYTQNGETYRNKTVPMDRLKPDPVNPGRKYNQDIRDVGEHALSEKSFLATGSHPIDDDALNRAIRDVHRHGRNSEAYRNAIMSRGYDMPTPEEPGPGMRQRDLSSLSSTSNPGLSRFVEATE